MAAVGRCARRVEDHRLSTDVSAYRRLCAHTQILMVRGESLTRMEWFAVVEWFGRPEIETDDARERRIVMEIVVDAYDEQERAIG